MEMNRKSDAISSFLQSSSTSFAVNRIMNGDIMNYQKIVGGSSDSKTESIKREMEKKRIRDELLAAENSRKQELQEEVIKELLIKGEISIQGLKKYLIESEKTGSVLNSQDGLGFASNPNLAGSGEHDRVIDDKSRPQDRIEGGIDGRNSSSQRGVGYSIGFPFQRDPKSTTVAAVKPIIHPQKTLPVKPVISCPSPTAGLKRKCETPNSEERSLVVNTEKKSRAEFMCEICDVWATCEENLKAHYSGKKHKSRTKDLLQEKSNINSYSSPLCEETKESSVPKIQLQSNSDAAQRIKFWCNLCNVGATSEVQMNEHENGNKHKKLMREQVGVVINGE